MPLVDGMAEHRVNLGSHEIAYSEGPDNGPPLVLVHGLTGRRDSFEPVVPALLPEFHLFAIDQRGHGLSGHVTGHYAIGDYSSDLIQVLRKLFGSPVFVWGQSLGAGVTLDAAGREPDLFDAVVLEDPPLRSGATRSALHETFVRWLDLSSSDLGVDEIERQLAGSNTKAAGAGARYKAETLHQLDPDVLRHAVENRIWNDYDVTAALTLVSCPAFLMQADPEAGGIIPDDVMASLQPLPPNFQHRKFTGSGHKVHADQPELAVAAVRDFLLSTG